MKNKKFTMGVLSLMLGVSALVGYSVERARAAGIPATQALTYSGVLTDPSGTPLTGSKNIQISIYDMATAGNLQCSAGPAATTLVNGGFRLTLPDTCTTAVHATPDAWIEVFVDGSSLGRTKLGAVPFAVETDHAKSADTATNATNATSATNATHATSADTATNALTTIFGSELNTTDPAASSWQYFASGCISGGVPQDTLNSPFCQLAANRKCDGLGYKAGTYVGEYGSSGDANTRTIFCIK